jgi:hypothetical protein
MNLMPTETTPNNPINFSRYIFDPSADPPPERVYYDGLLSEGDLGLWVGREKHRKTNIGLQLAICAALARSFLTFRFVADAPLKVVIFDWESKGDSLKRRYEALCRSMQLTDAEREQVAVNLKIFEFRRYVADGGILPKFPVKRNGQVSGDYHQALQFWIALIKDHPADLYIIDPMRCLDAQDENDSAIEELLAMIRRVFGKAAVLIAHHMTKRGNPKDGVALKDDMRGWSDGARGSGAIKAHADLIICQERVMAGDHEKVYWGAFLKDAPDIEPLPLVETDNESFLWCVSPEIPSNLVNPMDVVLKAGGPFKNNTAVADLLMKNLGLTRPTAYRRVLDLLNYGYLSKEDGQMVVQAMRLQKAA